MTAQAGDTILFHLPRQHDPAVVGIFNAGLRHGYQS